MRHKKTTFQSVQMAAHGATVTTYNRRLLVLTLFRWNNYVVLVSTLRRVHCPACSVKVEQVSRAQGKSPLTTEYKWFLAGYRQVKRQDSHEPGQQLACQTILTPCRKNNDLALAANTPGNRYDEPF